MLGKHPQQSITCTIVQENDLFFRFGRVLNHLLKYLGIDMQKIGALSNEELEVFGRIGRYGRASIWIDCNSVENVAMYCLNIGVVLMSFLNSMSYYNVKNTLLLLGIRSFISGKSINDQPKQDSHMEPMMHILHLAENSIFLYCSAMIS